MKWKRARAQCNCNNNTMMASRVEISRREVTTEWNTVFFGFRKFFFSLLHLLWHICCRSSKAVSIHSILPNGATRFDSRLVKKNKTKSAKTATKTNKEFLGLKYAARLFLPHLLCLFCLRLWFLFDFFLWCNENTYWIIYQFVSRWAFWPIIIIINIDSKAIKWKIYRHLDDAVISISIRFVSLSNSLFCSAWKLFFIVILSFQFCFYSRRLFRVCIWNEMFFFFQWKRENRREKEKIYSLEAHWLHFGNVAL